MSVIDAIENEWTETWFKFVTSLAIPIDDFFWWSEEHSNMTEMRGICQNTNLTLDFVLKHPKIKWDWAILSYHQHITMEMILNNMNKPWSFHKMSKNPNLTMEMILKFPKKNWDWKWMKTNLTKTTSGEFIHNKSNIYNGDNAYNNFSIKDVLNNLNATNPSMMHEQYFSENPNNAWNWSWISRHKNITMEDIDNHPELPWIWNVVCLNPNLTLDFVLKHPEIQWNFSWNGISSSVSFDINIFFAFPNENWYMSGVCANKNLTLQMILEHPEIQWDWGGLGYNPNITLDFVLKNINKNWIWCGLSKNPNLTIDFIIQHIDKKWNIAMLLLHPFTVDREMVITQKMKWLLLVSMYDYYDGIKYQTAHYPYSLFEQILVNDYLLKHIINF